VTKRRKEWRCRSGRKIEKGIESVKDDGNFTPGTVRTAQALQATQGAK